MKTIAISISPDVESGDVWQAIKMFFAPWNFFKKSSVRKLENWFEKYFAAETAVSFASGRAAIFIALQSLNIGKSDEVLLQSFTCIAVPNAVIATGAKPVYVDIDKTLTIDSVDLEKKISKKTKAIIVQHTFGIPTDMDKVNSIAKKHSLLVIEDCAHTIGGKFGSKKLGTFSDVAIFSFGRDKAFSSVFGGMAIMNNKSLAIEMRSRQEKLNSPSFFWTLQQVFHPIAFAIILPLYNVFSVGKILIIFFQKLHLLSFPITRIEKKGKQDSQFVKKFPNALAGLAFFQLQKIEKYNKKRAEFGMLYIEALQNTKFALAYDKEIPFLRFPVFSKNRDAIILQCKKSNIYLGNWYSNGIDPKGADFEKIDYDPKSCPVAESLAKTVINLPTYPKLCLDDIKRVVRVLETYA